MRKRAISSLPRGKKGNGTRRANHHVKIRLQKYSSFKNKNSSLQNVGTWPIFTPSRPFAKGRFAIVTNAGRAAVDAEGAFDVGTRRVRKKRVVLMPQAGIDGYKPGGRAGEST
jgi:hypothetical protein